MREGARGRAFWRQEKKRTAEKKRERLLDFESRARGIFFLIGCKYKRKVGVFGWLRNWGPGPLEEAQSGEWSRTLGLSLRCL